MARHLVTLAECPPGLFLHGETLGFKTEYPAMQLASDALSPGMGSWIMGNWPDAYCVASGEYFWGGTKTQEDRAALVVEPVTADVLFVQRSDGGQRIRKWSTKPFPEAAPVAAVEQDYPVTEERVGSLGLDTMTLRDGFAMQALAGMGTWTPGYTPITGIEGMSVRADWAYRQADAMIAVRGERNS